MVNIGDNAIKQLTAVKVRALDGLEIGFDIYRPEFLSHGRNVAVMESGVFPTQPPPWPYCEIPGDRSQD